MDRQPGGVRRTTPTAGPPIGRRVECRGQRRGRNGVDILGTVTIVTGSSSGIGAATVRRLASKGGNVVVNYSRSEGPARKVAEACEALGVEEIGRASGRERVCQYV